MALRIRSHARSHARSHTRSREDVDAARDAALDAPRSRSRREWWLAFAFVACVYALLATHQIALPGVYMDEVNPDYLAVNVLNPHPEPITTWTLPGNTLFNDRLAVLVALYHGSQTLWLGLPLFALLGTGVVGIRLAHAIFALTILLALHALLVRGGLRPWQSAVCCAALAVDPVFVYAFRTQSYITMAPTTWLFLSLLALCRARIAPIGHFGAWMFASGGGLGLAILGYFVYAFYAPAILLYAWTTAKRVRHDQGGTTPRWLVLSWIAGVCAGASIYVLGYALMAQELGGIGALRDYIVSNQADLGAFASHLSLSARLGAAATLLGSVFGNWWHHSLIFGTYESVPFAKLKMALLLALPPCLWLVREFRRNATDLLRMLVLLPVSFVACSLVFGDRLGGHHYMSLLPLAYAALGTALWSFPKPGPSGPGVSPRLAVVVFLALGAMNLAGEVEDSRMLAKTRGVGLYSDAINQLAKDLNAMPSKPFVYFPDWGLSIPVAMMTGATVPMDSIVDIARIRMQLCGGRDVAFAVIDGNRAERIESWKRQLAWSAPELASYRQADGSIVFQLATFKAAALPQSCRNPPATGR